MRELIPNHQIIVQHYYREGNPISDALAKYGASLEVSVTTMFNTIQEIPRKATGTYQMDKAQIYSFRVGKSKIKLRVRTGITWEEKFAELQAHMEPNMQVTDDAPLFPDLNVSKRRTEVSIAGP
ncbi:hypothetical protein RND71_013127 [Anisodus tanguticus]|uniref:Uncharacterized protein n=1 Tax=Anisodus tanguticus TaxID=243964 RepID=A0AAE1SGI0_9SOLA|nr:hypothetical protein RND71_013127 [Anisodus tanguticus]